MRHATTTAVALVQASHPVPAVAVTTVAAGLAASTGRTVSGVVTVTLAVLAGQLSVGWLNDLVDARSDAVVGRLGKPVAAGRLSPTVVRVSITLSALLAVVWSIPSGAQATAAHLVALISAWAYDLGAKRTPLSALPYAVSFGLLPAFVTLGLPEAPPPPIWLVTASASLGCAAHFVNALPDLADDAVVGVRGLPHRLGARTSRALTTGLVLLASLLLVLGPPGEPSAERLAALPTAALTLAVGLMLGRRPGSRAAFHAVLVVAVLDVLLLLSAGTLER